MAEPERWSCGCLVDRERNVVVLGCGLSARHTTGAEWDCDKLVAFLYILMRDHLPVGTVTGIVREVQGNAAGFVFTTEPLAELARVRAAELRA